MAVLIHADSPAQQFQQKIERDAAQLVVEWTGYMAGRMPHESEFGLEHTIEAFCSVAERVGGNEASQMLGYFGNQRSNDPAAHNAVSLDTVEGDTSYGYSVTINLPFLQKMNEGGTLTPISPRGRKAGGEDTVGVLYAPRTNDGVGMLMWFDAGTGTRRYATYRTYAGLHFVESSADDTTASAMGLGYTRN